MGDQSAARQLGDTYASLPCGDGTECSRVRQVKTCAWHVTATRPPRDRHATAARPPRDCDHHATGRLNATQAVPATYQLMAAVEEKVSGLKPPQCECPPESVLQSDGSRLHVRDCSGPGSARHVINAFGNGSELSPQRTRRVAGSAASCDRRVAAAWSLQRLCCLKSCRAIAA